MDLIHHLQTIDAVDVFTPRAVYDGRKNLFAVRELPFGPSNSQQVCLSDVLQPAFFTLM
jgi:eukaryotic translation initiation factor 2C